MNTINPYIQFPAAKLSRGMVTLLLFVIMNTTTGCFYYKSTTYHNGDPGQKKLYRGLKKSLYPGKYVMVHEGKKIWHLDNMRIDLPSRRDYSGTTGVLRGRLSEPDSVCMKYYNKYRKKRKRSVRYLIADEEYVISQVHVYIAENDSFATGKQVTIPASSISMIEPYKRAPGRTHATWTLAFFWLPRPGHHGGGDSQTGNAPARQFGPRR